MIRVKIIKKSNQTTIIASGHAQYSAKGSDIVCAAFSTLITHSVNNCTKVTATDKDGVLVAIFSDPKSIENKTLLNAFENTVNQLIDQYGQYISWC